MTAHPDLEEADIRHMIEYIMDLDAEEEAMFSQVAANGLPEDLDFTPGIDGLSEEELRPGAIAQVYVFEKDLSTLDDIDYSGAPVFEGVIPVIQAGDQDLEQLGQNFAILLKGFLKVPKNNNYTFRLRSDDGSRLTIDDQVIIDHDGLHGASPKDGEVALEAGYHPFQLEYFQAKGGASILLEWRSFDGPEFQVIPAPAYVHHRSDLCPQRYYAIRPCGLCSLSRCCCWRPVRQRPRRRSRPSRCWPRRRNPSWRRLPVIAPSRPQRRHRTPNCVSSARWSMW
jgi:cytochrome c